MLISHPRPRLLNEQNRLIIFIRICVDKMRIRDRRLRTNSSNQSVNRLQPLPGLHLAFQRLYLQGRLAMIAQRLMRIHHPYPQVTLMLVQPLVMVATTTI
jgi:hypothetical protein